MPSTLNGVQVCIFERSVEGLGSGFLDFKDWVWLGAAGLDFGFTV